MEIRNTRQSIQEGVHLYHQLLRLAQKAKQEGVYQCGIFRGARYAVSEQGPRVQRWSATGKIEEGSLEYDRYRKIGFSKSELERGLLEMVEFPSTPVDSGAVIPSSGWWEADIQRDVKIGLDATDSLTVYARDRGLSTPWMQENAQFADQFEQALRRIFIASVLLLQVHRSFPGAGTFYRLLACEAPPGTLLEDGDGIFGLDPHAYLLYVGPIDDPVRALGGMQDQAGSKIVSRTSEIQKVNEHYQTFRDILRCLPGERDEFDQQWLQLGA